jgi:hypothetical protein
MWILGNEKIQLKNNFFKLLYRVFYWVDTRCTKCFTEWTLRYSMYQVFMCTECDNETLGTTLVQYSKVCWVFSCIGYRGHSVHTSPSVFVYWVSPSVHKDINLPSISLFWVCVPTTLSTILYWVFCTERRHSVEIAITIRTDRRRSFCTECLKTLGTM